MNKITKQAAGYKGQTIDNEHCSVCTMFRSPDSCTLVEGSVRPGGWCKFFDRETVGKVSNMTIVTEGGEFKLFMPFGKADKQNDGSVIVHGYASTPNMDSDGEIVTLKAVKAALPGYMAWGNIREMHRLSAVGTARDAKVDNNGLLLTARIVDKEAVKKVTEGVYKGFSIGGRKLAKVGDQITEIDMNEISIVDRPANPECKFDIAKSFKKAPDAGGFLLKVSSKSPQTKAARALIKAAANLMSQDNPPAAHDGFSLPANKVDNPSPKDDEQQNNKIGGPAMAAGGTASISLTEKRDVGTKERSELASEGKANPDGSFPIASKEDLKNAIKLRGHGDKKKNEKLIRRRAKELDAEDQLPDDMKAKAAKKAAKKARKAAKSRALSKAASIPLTPSAEPSFLTLSAESADHASGASPLRHDGLGSGPELRSQEGRTLKKTIDTESNHFDIKREGIAMTDKTNDEIQLDLNDPMVKAVVSLLQKRAPSKKELFAKAMNNMKKLNKSRKEAKGAIEEAHGMMKASYLAKAAKSKGKDPDGDGDDNCEDVMKVLQKAYNAVENIGTFRKAAMNDLAKAVGSPGQEVTDGNAFFQVPPGVKSTTVEEIATAGPGGTARGSTPFEIVLDQGPIAGKADMASTLQKFAKNGQVPVEIVELLTQLTKANGEAEALRSLPARTGNARPRGFDMNKLASSGASAQDVANDRDALFKGVDVNDMNGIDETRHVAAASKVIGNYLTNPNRFAKSITDPAFHGAAGG